ncbi:MAG: hypothetical protein A3G49_03075 [Candidatus Sungbacteria bacterium RIFCSPLOWO2_12_FULL_41_11]|uniref:Uncharacterized protein n=1 Tax=Candidatus Sungbacteria bacterium RIFCSPLOWO2_12_FULL_41_11 TaxID=1802286 RepID=A0A1G2LRH8_9BACT|nr:MAG: hypothetical protein A3D41_05985 [Candidatus Sungbacteria bacterium RIFCSPHIGHO2_02_FULL_41_12b]OHA14197.1 MAG: hypothetical protein A3G49_03075 [Candidatus Sungbacteria bacterium RIFCSPLOWO2_12_FULL_41_11]
MVFMGLFDVIKPHISSRGVDEVMSELSRRGAFTDTQKKFVRAVLETDLDLTTSAGSSERGVDEEEIKEAIGRFRGSKLFSDGQIEILEELLRLKLRRHGMF